MKPVAPTTIDGVAVLASFVSTDARGSLARVWPLDSAPGGFEVEQVLVSRNTQQYTLRGMHFQRASAAERKIVGVLHGRILDVVVDLRRESATYLQWAAVELNGHEPVVVVLPRGVAHGFLTLEKDTEVSYLLDRPYRPSHACGLRWDDPLIGIEWPCAPVNVSDQDASWPPVQSGFSALAE